MKAQSHGALRGSLAAMLCLAFVRVAPAQAPAAAPASSPAVTSTNAAVLQKVTVRIKLTGKYWGEVELVGRQDDKIFYREHVGTLEAPRSFTLDAVEDSFFPVQYDDQILYDALAAQNWMGAAAILLPAVKPFFPYLDIGNNNVVDLAVDVGDYMMRAGDIEGRAAKTPEDEQKVQKKYEAAYAVLQEAAKAEWSSKATIARVKSIKCLLVLNKPKTAEREFGKVEEPAPGDAVYGVYWLVKAEVNYRRKNYPAALDDAVKSLCFENKDTDTFPDALMMSARCYEELLEWYRARDVYFEVAKLFPSTDWSTRARERLQSIMDRGVTKADEVMPVENVFFGLKEKMNDMSLALLRGEEAKDEPPANLAEEPEEPEETKPAAPAANPDGSPPDEGRPTDQTTPPAKTPSVKIPAMIQQQPAQTPDKPAAAPATPPPKPDKTPKKDAKTSTGDAKTRSKN